MFPLTATHLIAVALAITPPPGSAWATFSRKKPHTERDFAADQEDDPRRGMLLGLAPIPSHLTPPAPLSTPSPRRTQEELRELHARAEETARLNRVQEAIAYLQKRRDGADYSASIAALKSLEYWYLQHPKQALPTGQFSRAKLELDRVHEFELLSSARSKLTALKYKPQSVEQDELIESEKRLEKSALRHIAEIEQKLKERP